MNLLLIQMKIIMSVFSSPERKIFMGSFRDCNLPAVRYKVQSLFCCVTVYVEEHSIIHIMFLYVY